MCKNLVFVMVVLGALLVPSVSFAHPGGTDAFGCHGGSVPYHCHGGSSGGTPLRIDLSASDVFFGMAWSMTIFDAGWFIPMLTHFSHNANRSMGIAINTAGTVIAFVSEISAVAGLATSNGAPDHIVHFGVLTGINSIIALTGIGGVIFHSNRIPVRLYSSGQMLFLSGTF